MKYLKQLSAAAACLAFAGSLTAGAVSPSCTAQKTVSTSAGCSQNGSLPASLQQVLQQLCGASGCSNGGSTAQDAVKSALQSTASCKTASTCKTVPLCKTNSSCSTGSTPQAAAPTGTPTSNSANQTTANGQTDNSQTTPSGTTADSQTNDTTASTENTTTDTTSDSDSYAAQVVTLVNQERAAQGLKALTVNTKVQAAAQVRAKETAQSFSHTRPNGTSCFTALAEQGVTYQSAGENIAYGQSTPAEVMNAWMNSAGHRANILNANFTTIGVGYTVINGQAYWTQEFIS